MPDVLKEPFNIPDAVGAICIGVGIALVLGGIAFQQAATYYRQYPRDKLGIKIVVGLLIFLNFMDCACLIYTNYHWSLKTWGDRQELNNLPTTDGINYIIGGIVTLTVESFYAYRIYLLSRRVLASIAIALLGFIQCSLLCVTAIYGFVTDSSSSFEKIQPVVYAWFICVAVSDMIVISFVMYQCLKSTGIIPKNISILDRISIMVIQSNFFTGLCVVTCGICLITLNHALWGTALYYSVVKMYMISLLTTLNSRPYVEEKTFIDRRRASVSAPIYPDPLFSVKSSDHEPKHRQDHEHNNNDHGYVNNNNNEHEKDHPTRFQLQNQSMRDLEVPDNVVVVNHQKGVSSSTAENSSKHNSPEFPEQ